MPNHNLEHEKYQELLALTQLFLLQNYSLDQRIPSDKNTYDFFRTLALKSTPTKPVEYPPKPVEVKTISSPVKQQAVEPPPAQKSLPNAVPSQFELQPIQPVTKTASVDFKNLIQKHAPGISIHDQIPDNIKARSGNPPPAIKKPSILLIHSDLPADQLNFVQNMAKGISNTLSLTEALKANEIEEKGAWNQVLASPELKLIVTVSLNLKNFPQFIHHIKELPIIKITDVAPYLVDQKLKASLWHSIKSTIQSS